MNDTESAEKIKSCIPSNMKKILGKASAFSGPTAVKRASGDALRNRLLYDTQQFPGFDRFVPVVYSHFLESGSALVFNGLFRPSA